MTRQWSRKDPGESHYSLDRLNKLDILDNLEYLERIDILDNLEYLEILDNLLTPNI